MQFEKAQHTAATLKMEEDGHEPRNMSGIQNLEKSMKKIPP